MLVQKYTRFHSTEHRDVEPGVIIEEEGVALVYSHVGNKTYVKPSTGAANEVFAGFSLSRNSPPRFLPRVMDNLVVPESGVVELNRVPLTGQILVKIAGDVQTISANAPAAGTVQLVGSKLFFFTGTPQDGVTPAVPGDQGHELYIQFVYEPSVNEARTIIGDAPIGGLPSSYQERIGVTARSEAIGTTCYDASKDWSGVTHPKLGVDGKLTTDGTGTTLTMCIVMGGPVGDAASYGALPIKVIAA